MSDLHFWALVFVILAINLSIVFYVWKKKDSEIDFLKNRLSGKESIIHSLETMVARLQLRISESERSRAERMMGSVTPYVSPPAKQARAVETRTQTNDSSGYNASSFLAQQIYSAPQSSSSCDSSNYSSSNSSSSCSDSSSSSSSGD